MMKSEPLPRRFTMEDMEWARSMLRKSIGELGLPRRFMRRLIWLGFNCQLPTVFDIFTAAGSMNVYELQRLEDGIGPTTCAALYDAMVKHGFMTGDGDYDVDRRICWLCHAVWQENQGTAYHGKWYKFYFDRKEESDGHENCGDLDRGADAPRSGS